MKNSNWMECPNKSKKLGWLPTVLEYCHKSRICPLFWAGSWKSFHLESEFLYSFVQFVDKLVTRSVKSNFMWVNWKYWEGKIIHVSLFLYFGCWNLFMFLASHPKRECWQVYRGWSNPCSSSRLDIEGEKCTFAATYKWDCHLLSGHWPWWLIWSGHHRLQKGKF